MKTMKRWFDELDWMDLWTAVLAVIFLLLVMVLPVGAQSGLGSGGGTIPPAPPNPERPVWVSYLPVVHERAFPQPMPAEGEEYVGQEVNVDIYAGGETGSPWEYFHATYLLTARPNESSAFAAVCWYGTWANGAGAARCDLYDWLGE